MTDSSGLELKKSAWWAQIETLDETKEWSRGRLPRVLEPHLTSPGTRGANIFSGAAQASLEMTFPGVASLPHQLKRLATALTW